MKKITVTIASRDYTISLEDDFARSFERDWEVFLGGKKYLDVKELLSAFVQKCYENYQQERDLENLARKLSQEIS
ncbi:hypothetical protein [Campylobacter sp. RM16187]|uniref:hypothetical protein n=1 Tax=Campylobacter sp. RM16187 TaxID=1660063 RepID=UPI0021B65AAE|nr:hypothetical protein [Campylobacter sp. RM16187]QKG29572.1 hypothetical protein CDOMF_1319 [Campylobacter sp. RM16187]